ncbi:hypothetical protein DSCOOX_26710 [Desulfosarcina ovata subsp. ovata]|uniref:Uncharacterized protein n=1 Tax=Desulfosarcina ovata subsp. ovata TaxID=2752305 RepID=A0A5K8AAF1_9BACT|nr:hypothetical protein [Desulfosarcina ovata]BBO89491.1 hypothetical protein DSCOOX_26710 [Desulfosarcina ovata subsp. ovata]
MEFEFSADIQENIIFGFKVKIEGALGHIRRGHDVRHAGFLKSLCVGNIDGNIDQVGFRVSLPRFG